MTADRAGERAAPEPPQPGPEDIRQRIALFLASHTTLCLATTGADGAPCAAAVFYAHDDDLNLFFVSEAGSQHGRNLLANPAAAGAIQADGQDWREICGLQLRGTATRAPALFLAHAMHIYARKFPFVGGLLTGSGGPAALAGPIARARWWILRPHWFRLVDNRVRFGYKEELLP